VGKADETYFVKRAEGLFRFMEEVTGNSFDQKEFDEALRCEKECSAIFRELLEQTQRRPSPVSLFDLLVNAALGYIQFRCRPMGVELLLKTKKEIDERIADGVTGITNEKHRILFESNPPWFSMFDLQEWAAERDAVIVASSVPLALWNFSDFEGLTGMCNASTAHWGNWSLEHNLQNQKSLIEDWNCDGVMMMDNRGCKVIAFPVPETASYVENELGVPVMRFDGNMADSRDFDDQKVREQLNAFIDLLEERRQ
jgi:benzoyl-CoA reductase/2-hydroxyglutaryl-CoA dehydratase subunit BcrC/BadD/HgdB